MSKNLSRGSRTGVLLTKAKKGFSTTEDKSPFAAFQMESEINIGGEVVKEKSNVLLLGDALNALPESLETLEPGSTTVRLNCCVFYMRPTPDGQSLLCFRATEEDQVEFIVKSALDVVDACDFFESHGVKTNKK